MARPKFGNSVQTVDDHVSRILSLNALLIPTGIIIVVIISLHLDFFFIKRVLKCISNKSAQEPLHNWVSGKHAYIILIPLNPTFIK